MTLRRPGALQRRRTALRLEGRGLVREAKDMHLYKPRVAQRGQHSSPPPPGRGGGLRAARFCWSRRGGAHAASVHEPAATKQSRHECKPQQASCGGFGPSWQRLGCAPWREPCHARLRGSIARVIWTTLSSRGHGTYSCRCGRARGPRDGELWNGKTASCAPVRAQARQMRGEVKSGY